jgi:transposase
MVHALALAPHLSTDELEAAARSCEDGDLRTRIEAIRLVSMDWPLTEVGEALGRTRGWVRSLVKRFNEESLIGLEDRRQGNPGAELRLNDDDIEALKKALAGKAPDGGLWTGPKVRTWIAERTGKHAGLRLGWRYLKRLNYSLQQPQTQHGAANLEAQDAFKKRSNRSSTTSRVSSPKPVSKSGHKTKLVSD